MQGLINFINRFKDYIAFTFLVVISLSLISIGDLSQLGGFRSFIIATVGWTQELFAWIPNPGALESENRALRRLNHQLSTEYVKMRHSAIENDKLREMIGFKSMEQENVVTAEIVGRSTIELRDYLTLNKGELDGVYEGMAVRTASGLVGIIIGSSNTYSLVESILNRNVKISGKILRNNISGIVIWEGSNNFLLKNIPESFDVQVGDKVVTSNYSNKYPPDIPVAQVVNIESDPSSLFLRVELEPVVDFSILQEVFIVLAQSDPERRELIKEMEERLRALKGD